MENQALLKLIELNEEKSKIINVHYAVFSSLYERLIEWGPRVEDNNVKKEMNDYIEHIIDLLN